MAQVTDWDVDNGGGGAVRGQMNGIIAALQSSNSGATAPSPTVGGQLWWDTSGLTASLKVRNTANDGWEEVALLAAQPISAVLGLTGAVMPFAMASAPTGWLVCDGSAVSRTTYADLFAAIGTSYGTGDGSTTFNLPDLRGEFVRGWDNGAGNDPDAASRTDRGDGTTGDNVGTKQGDEFESHTHVQNGWGNGTGTGSFNASTGEGTQRNVQPTDARGGNETRPRNIALHYCIKT